MSPGYPYLLGAIFRVAGTGVLPVVLVQMLAGLLTGWLLFRLGARLWSPRAGLAAMALYLLDPLAVFHEGVLQKAALVNVLNVSVLALAARGGPGPLLAAGLLLGLSAHVRPDALLLAPVVAAWALLRGGRRGLAAGLFACGLAAALLPVAARNLAVGGELVLTTAHGGMNLYTGNSPSARGPYLPLAFAGTDPRREQADFRAEAGRRAGRSLSAAESDAFWRGEALRFVRENPGRWALLLARKALVFANGYEQPINLDVHLFREEGVSMLGWPLPGWSLLFPLAAAGMVLAPANLLVAGCLLAYLLSGLLFFVVSEYRFAAVPALALLAGAGLDALPGAVRGRRRARLAAAGAVFAVLLFLARFDVHGRWLGLPDFARHNLAASYLNLGTVLAERGEADAALRALERSLALFPAAEPLRVVGDVRLRQGDRAGAIRAYEESIRRIPFAVTWDRLGIARAGGGDLAGAEAAFREAARIDPSSGVARFNLADTLGLEGRTDEAAAWYEETLRVDPGRAEAHNNLGVILEGKGRGAEAEAHYRAALAARPDYADAAGNLGAHLLERGRGAEAAAWLERARRLRAAPAGPASPAAPGGRR